MNPLAIALASLLMLATACAGLVEVENQYRAEYELKVRAKHAAAVAELDEKYAGALERALGDASKAGRLEAAVALKTEIQRIQEKGAFPAEDEGASPEVAQFRQTYRTQSEKLVIERERMTSPIVQEFGMALVALQNELTQAGKLEDALVVRNYIAAGIYKNLTGGAMAVEPSSATPERPFANSLGMKFVPVPVVGGPTAGKAILFCIWETRVQDYETFVNETKVPWPKPSFPQGPDHPAVNVTWDDANAFCVWLTEAERGKRKIGPNDLYRLPSDHEWSCALGLGKDEDASKMPADKDGRVPGFPWGKDFPPPPKYGNFKWSVPGGDDDGFTSTAPVGSFQVSALGLYDLSGNVWEWCEDCYKSDSPAKRVLRGGSWGADGGFYLGSSRRDNQNPGNRSDRMGFRCALEAGSDGLTRRDCGY